MSFTNYYREENGFNYELAIYCAVILVLIAIYVWYKWSINYRYSSDRIEDKLLKKYSQLKDVSENSAKNANQVMLADQGQLSSDGRTASAVITIREKDIETIANQVSFSLPVKSSCSPIDTTCISL